MNDTVFYVLGIALVVVALVVSFIGLRFDKFPTSRGLLIGGTVAIAALVGATMVFAWRNAADEKHHREAELAADAAANQQAGNTAEADEEVGSGAATAPRRRRPRQRPRRPATPRRARSCSRARAASGATRSPPRARRAPRGPTSTAR